MFPGTTRRVRGALHLLSAAVVVAALASCTATGGHRPSQSGDLPHYRIEASIAPGSGELTSDVTVSLPPSAASTAEFILGARFELQPVESSPRAVMSVEPTDKPIEGLQKIRLDFGRPLDRPATLRFRYRGPIFASADQDRLGYSPDVIEMALELMWLPFVAELNRRFTVDAQIRGVPADLVVVAQGEIEHSGDRVRIRRDTGDFDFAWTAVRGLQSVSAPGLEFYARDLQDPMVSVLRKHSLDAARFHQQWFGPMPGGTIRLAVVPRKTGGAYARAGYTIIPDARSPGEPAKEFSEVARATTVAHEFAHAWWSPADPLTEDYWLSESFAQYASLRYIEAVFGRGQLEGDIAKLPEAVKDAGPVLGRGRPSRVVLYQKGPLLLMRLEQQIGRERLDQVLATVARRPPRYTSEFLTVLRDVAGDTVATGFDAQLRAP